MTEQERAGVLSISLSFEQDARMSMPRALKWPFGGGALFHERGTGVPASSPSGARETVITSGLPRL